MKIEQSGTENSLQKRILTKGQELLIQNSLLRTHVFTYRWAVINFIKRHS